jgi:hypothetical protein
VCKPLPPSSVTARPYAQDVKTHGTLAGGCDEIAIELMATSCDGSNSRVILAGSLGMRSSFLVVPTKYPILSRNVYERSKRRDEYSSNH